MADQDNDSTPTADEDPASDGPAQDAVVAPLEGEDPADTGLPSAEDAPGEPEAPTEPEPEPAGEAAPGPTVLTADEETLAAAAIPVRSAVSEPAAPRFGAQFSSPEPTTVTARPRRRATRPALAADPDSVEPAPSAAPTLPAFITFVAPAEVPAEAPVAPRRRSRRTAAETPAEPAEPVVEPAGRPDAEVEGPPEGARWAPRRGRGAAAARAAAAREEERETAQPDVDDVQDETPEPVRPAPRRSRSRRRAIDPDAVADETDETPVVDDGADEPSSDRSEDAETTEDPDEAGDDEDNAGGTSRRRRRGRRGRGRGRTGEDAGEDDTDDDARTGEQAAGEPDDEAPETGDAADADEPETASSTRRRRRRRRRGESSGTATEDAVEETEERPERAGRGGRTSEDDVVRGIAGSTRLEAKRQRRRDGRDTGRRRAPILSESEFLARREAVDRAMVIRQQGDRTQIAVLEDDVLVEHYVTQAQATSFAGNVYLGRVQNVLPSMEAAFVDIGKGRNAVVYAGEVNWEAAGLTGKSRSIEQAFSSGDKILCQVTKDPIGHKGARLTQQINLPGRFLVYVPGGSMTGISRKLPDNERQRLKDILKKIVPEDAGVIIRTAAEGASEEELTRDVARLQAQWDVIQKKAESSSQAPALLYGEPDLAIRVIRDVFNEDFKRLVVQGADAYDTVEQYLGHVSPELSPRLQRYTGTGDVFRDLRVDEQLMKALDRKVYLPSGGSLVIDRTEAMTVVDVNTGKFVGSGGNLEQTVTRNNIEAAEEIVRQLRLRDIGGIIVIDFIDMVLESNRDLVLRRLTECLGRDRTKHQVAEVTSLGLVQMTRKRVGQGLLEVFSEPCEHCRGRGVLVHLDPVEPGRRSSGNGPGGNGSGGNGTGGSGSGGSGSGPALPGPGRGGEQNGRQRGQERGRDGAGAGDVVAVAENAGTEAEVVEEIPRSGSRRSRGRRNRGQSGEARAAEDAAVVATLGDDVELVDTAVDSTGDDAAADTQAADTQAADTAVDDAPAADASATGTSVVDDAVTVPGPQGDVPDAVAPVEGTGTPVGEPEVVELVVAEVVEGSGEPEVTEVPAPVHATDAYVTEIRLADVQGEVQRDVQGDVQGEVQDGTTPSGPEPREPAVDPAAEASERPAAAGPVEPAVEPAVEVAAPQARPRRRRAASRPAGPPA
ncbi:Rne/Rng family ribonuclease [Goekera deserti]|uniref:Rne/Rng family ribonuclease n=1 Tax=Goekera deserti TaxID=2497753 RepID=UPI001F331DAF|nr:Rne/Rng family ribonuclease [Goekera deserti]